MSFPSSPTNGQIAITGNGITYVYSTITNTWSRIGITSVSVATNIAGGAANQILYQSTTGTTTFNNGLTFNGTVFTATNVIIPGTANATSTTTGALTVAGGVGIGGSLYVSGEIVAQKLTIEYTTVTTTLVKTDDIIQTTNNTAATSTTTGALVVAGGAGIGGSLYVGGIVTATNVFVGGYAVSTASSLTIQSSGVSQGTAATVNFGTGLSAAVATNVATVTINTATLVATAVTLANTSTAQVGYAANILGNGAGNGALHYQSAPNTTAFLGQGSAGWLLVSAGAGSAPAFTNTGSIYVNSAVNANNIIGGAANQIPYQSGAGTTTFSNGLTFNGTVFTATNIVVPGTTNSTNTTTGALTVVGGVGVGGTLQASVIVSRVAQDFVTSITANSATTTIDLSLGNTFYVTVSANTTFAFSNVPTGTNLTNFSIITYNSAGGYAISWPASVTWAGGQTPTRTTTSAKSDAYTFFTLNAGTTIIGSLSILGY